MISLTKLDKSQRKELAKYWFDLSKLALISFVIKLLEPGSITSVYGSLPTIFSGLTVSVLFVILGLRFSKE